MLVKIPLMVLGLVLVVATHADGAKRVRPTTDSRIDPQKPGFTPNHLFRQYFRVSDPASMALLEAKKGSEPLGEGSDAVRIRFPGGDRIYVEAFAGHGKRPMQHDDAVVVKVGWNLDRILAAPDQIYTSSRRLATREALLEKIAVGAIRTVIGPDPQAAKSKQK